MLRSRPRPRPPALLLLPRTEYLPYPSWPVPAAGPFLAALSTVGISGAVLALRPKSPNRGLLFARLGLGVRVPVEDGLTGGRKLGMIPRPEGAGVPSLGDVNIGLGEPLEGRRKAGDGSWVCIGEPAVILGSALRLLSEKLTPERLLWMTGFMLCCNCGCRSGAPSRLGLGGGLLY
jgi:hypothetical protein